MEHHSLEQKAASAKEQSGDHWFDPIHRPQFTIDHFLAYNWEAPPPPLITRQDRAIIEEEYGNQHPIIVGYNQSVYRINTLGQVLDAIADIASAHNLNQWPYLETALALREDMIQRIGTSDNQVPMPEDIVNDVHELARAVKDELVARSIIDQSSS